MVDLTENRTLFHEGNSPPFALLISKLAKKFRKFYVSLDDLESDSEDSTESPPTLRNVVLTHNVMIKIFNDALRDSQWILKDKLGDQFLKLPGIGGAVVTTMGNTEALNLAKDAYSSRQAGGPSVSGKRSRTDEMDVDPEPEPEPRPGPSKRSRTRSVASKKTLKG